MKFRSRSRECTLTQVMQVLYGKEEQVNVDYIGHIFYMCILLTTCSGNSVKGHAGSCTQPNFNLISTVQNTHKQKHTQTNTHKQTHTNIQIRTTHTYKHTQTHTHTNTQTHTHKKWMLQKLKAFESTHTSHTNNLNVILCHSLNVIDYNPISDLNIRSY